MPSVSITATSGEPASVFYNISTPSEVSAKSIDPTLPTILCIHGVYVAQQIFESQFNDPRLRQFNLLAVDRLGHGDTKGRVTDDYDPLKTAEDMKRVMDALKIPYFHILGLGVGTIVAQELAIAYPQSVKSLTLVSVAPFAEPEGVNQGRKQVFDYWRQLDESKDNSFLEDIVFGAMQLLFHNHVNHQAKAIRDILLQQCFRNWMGSEENLIQARYCNLNYYTNRRILTKNELSMIKAPVQFFHGSDDVAYPYEHTVNVANDHRAVGVEVAGVYKIHGPHNMLLMYPDEINPRLRDLVLRVEGRKDKPLAQEGPLRTPWTDVLTERGFYKPAYDSDSD
ncbi:Alpha/Beta hydrolase protein [Schizophyllum fasciatum]